MAKQLEREQEFKISPRRTGVPWDKYGHIAPVYWPGRIARSARPRSTACAARIYRLHTARHGFGVWRAAGKYLVRNAAQHPGSAAFGPNGPVGDPRELVGNWYRAGDVRAYKVVISPLDATCVDLPQLTRDIIARIDREPFLSGASGPLEWVAAAHYDTDHPHVHMIVRGVAGGEEFRMLGSFKDWRRHASLAIQQQLGLGMEHKHKLSKWRDIDYGNPNTQKRVIYGGTF